MNESSEECPEPRPDAGQPDNLPQETGSYFGNLRLDSRDCSTGYAIAFAIALRSRRSDAGFLAT
jgi:hypothetical protein